MRQQQQSKTFKSGEALDHHEAVHKVFMFLFANKKDRNWTITTDHPLVYTKDKEFIKQLPEGRFPAHSADIAILKETYNKEGEIRKFKDLAIIEINGKHGGYYKNEIGRIRKYSPTKHDKPIQQKNDKIVQNWCERKKIKYIVLLKEEILGDCGRDGKDEVDTTPYLREKLKEFVK